jgi:hypothetical protein
VGPIAETLAGHLINMLWRDFILIVLRDAEKHVNQFLTHRLRGIFQISRS